MPWISSGKQDIYVDIAEKYEQYIHCGLFKCGDKLPSVRQAAGEMGVNPNTVARAYALLEEKGYLRALPKKGAFVIWREGDSAIDCRPILRDWQERGLSYDELISQAKEVFQDHD